MGTYLIDFDGTLVDSMWHWAKKMTTALNMCNVSYPDNIIEIITPLGDKGTAKYFKEVLGVRLSEEEMLKMMHEQAYNSYAYEIQAKETVVETVKKMKDRGDNINVLTASPHTLLDVCLKRIGIFDVFDNVWSCDDFHTTKGNPKIYEMAAEKLGVSPCDCVFVDDNINSLLTAKKATLKIIGVYDKSSDNSIEEIKSTVDAYIYKFSEILNVNI